MWGKKLAGIDSDTPSCLIPNKDAIWGTACRILAASVIMQREATLHGPLTPKDRASTLRLVTQVRFQQEGTRVGEDCEWREEKSTVLRTGNRVKVDCSRVGQSGTRGGLGFRMNERHGNVWCKQGRECEKAGLGRVWNGIAASNVDGRRLTKRDTTRKKKYNPGHQILANCLWHSVG